MATGPLGALLGGLLEASGSALGASWVVERPSWASWTDLSATLGPLGPSWSVLGPSRGPLGPSWGPLRALLARLGALLGPKKSRGKTPGVPGLTREAQEDFAIWALVP